MRTTLRRAVFFLLFTASGFAGLIYESIWSHYLKLFLGHAAYAQSLVLVTFMGGMALGSWLAAWLSPRWPQRKYPLLAYAVCEGLIGLITFAFHPGFEALTGWAHGSLLPALTSPTAAMALKWALAALLILPQSVLLGMTFPLMSSSLLRLWPESSGSTIAMLYFTNSLGAAIGVLVSGFVLVATLGLPGTLLCAGSINLVLALIVWVLTRSLASPSDTSGVTRPAGRDEALPRGGPQLPIDRLFLSVSLLTGTASFVYEIGWIRMLSLVLGSSTHSFELMLSAFILGLALGSLWIRRRIDGLAHPVRFLGWVQVAMGALALSTLVSYDRTFDFMRWLLGALNRSDGGYVLFHVSSHLLASALMLPATFCAGMTLPLLTTLLLRQGAGERSIGAVYAANTIGSILGALGAIHVALPWLGLKGSMVLGASLDMGLGLVLLWRHAAGTGRLLRVATIALVGAAVALVLGGVRLDTLKMASGVYRDGRLHTPADAQVLFHRDGKTATIDVVRDTANVTIRTNGKVDAAVSLRDRSRPSSDESTMTMLATLPLALRPEARTAATIGFGSGMTSHLLLLSPTLTRLDTIEIESAVVEAAQHFRPSVERVYSDPRSHIHVEDAKTYFSLQHEPYDIIISEPSNPWVSGVSSLFTEEFYREVRGHLAPEGLLVQWVQLYEIEPRLVASVVMALSPYFSDYVIYAPDQGDLLIVAQNGGRVRPARGDVFGVPDLRAELGRFGIRNVSDLEARRIGGKEVLQPLFESYSMPPNSDYFPVLDLAAERTRFRRQGAHGLVGLASTVIPVLELLDRQPGRVLGPTGEETLPGPSQGHFPKVEAIRLARAVRDALLQGDDATLELLGPELRLAVERLRRGVGECGDEAASKRWRDSAHRLAFAVTAHLPAKDLEAVWSRVEEGMCRGTRSQALQRWMALYRALGRRDARALGQLGEELLREEGGLSRNRRAYLLTATLAGRLADGRREGLAELWDRYAVQTFPVEEQSLLPRLLWAHVHRPF